MMVTSISIEVTSYFSIPSSILFYRVVLVLVYSIDVLTHVLVHVLSTCSNIKF